MGEFGSLNFGLRSGGSMRRERRGVGDYIGSRGNAWREAFPLRIRRVGGTGRLRVGGEGGG